MSENFKVNSKTSTLEFKRKHNNLVDGVVDIVNEGINSGEIIIPKQEQTYLHTILFIVNTNSVYGELHLSFLSTRKISYTSIQEIFNDVGNKLNGHACGGFKYSKTVLVDNKYDVYLAEYISEINSTSITAYFKNITSSAQQEYQTNAFTSFYKDIVTPV